METEPESHVVFYDTETTGLPLWKEPSEHPGQPHIVSLAAIVVDLKTRETVASMDVIVKPEGWTSDPEALATHGISHELAMEVGIPEMFAVQMLMMLWKGRVRIGHNEPFDARIVRTAQKRYVRMFSETQCEAWKAGRKLCTQSLSTPIVKAAPSEKMLAKGMTWAKSANLREAYEYFMGKPMEGAHNAMADVLGCRDVFFAIQDRAGIVFPGKDAPAAAPKRTRAAAPPAAPAPAPAPAAAPIAAPAEPARPSPTPSRTCSDMAQSIIREVIRTTGVQEPIKRSSVAEIAALIGADTLDTVALRHLGSPLHTMLVDDAGIKKNLPVNALATSLYRLNRLHSEHEIRGDVVVVPDGDFA